MSGTRCSCGACVRGNCFSRGQARGGAVPRSPRKTASILLPRAPPAMREHGQTLLSGSITTSQRGRVRRQGCNVARRFRPGRQTRVDCRTTSSLATAGASGITASPRSLRQGRISAPKRLDAAADEQLAVSQRKHFNLRARKRARVYWPARVFSWSAGPTLRQGKLGT